MINLTNINPLKWFNGIDTPFKVFIFGVVLTIFGGLLGAYMGYCFALKNERVQNDNNRVNNTIEFFFKQDPSKMCSVIEDFIQKKQYFIDTASIRIISNKYCNGEVSRGNPINQNTIIAGRIENEDRQAIKNALVKTNEYEGYSDRNGIYVINIPDSIRGNITIEVEKDKFEPLAIVFGLNDIINFHSFVLKKQVSNGNPYTQ